MCSRLLSKLLYRRIKGYRQLVFATLYFDRYLQPSIFQRKSPLQYMYDT